LYGGKNIIYMEFGAFWESRNLGTYTHKWVGAVIRQLLQQKIPKSQQCSKIDLSLSYKSNWLMKYRSQRKEHIITSSLWLPKP
jgi:hypothetical protein